MAWTTPNPIRAALPSELRTAEGDPRRRAELVVASTWVTAGITAGLACIRFITEGSSSVVGWVLSSAAVGFATAPLLLRLRRGVTMAAAALPILALVSLAAMGAVDGGVDSDATIWFPFVPIVAALFLRERCAFTFTASTVVALVVVSIASTSNLDAQAASRLMAACGAVVFAGSLSWFYERGRQRAESALHAAQQRSEALLAAAPDTIARISATGDVLDLRLAPAAGWTPPPGSLACWSASPNNPLLTQVMETMRSGTTTRREHVLRDERGEVDCEVCMAPHTRDDVVTLVRDVSERKRVERLKADFISSVSHELRTPLTSLGGAVKLLGSSSLTDAQAAKLLAVAHRNVSRLDGLVEGLLEFQQLEVAPRQPYDENLDLAEFLESLLGRMRTANPAILFELDAPTSRSVNTDPRGLTQVLEELLSNAIKFSPDGGSVRVVVSKRGDGCRIAVEDDGPGIDAQARPFEPFMSGDTSDDRERYGLGMGLALARRITDSMGARIGFDCPPEAGCRFWVDLVNRPAAQRCII